MSLTNLDSFSLENIYIFHTLTTFENSLDPDRMASEEDAYAIRTIIRMLFAAITQSLYMR